MTWQPHDERYVKGHFVVRLRSTHSHEAAHEIVLNGRTLRVLPDGHTTARKRSDIITEALTNHSRASGELANESALLASLVGSLVLAGATALELDGQALLPASEGRGQWRVLFNDDGTVAATYLGEPT